MYILRTRQAEILQNVSCQFVQKYVPSFSSPVAEVSYLKQIMDM